MASRQPTPSPSRGEVRIPLSAPVRATALAMAPATPLEGRFYLFLALKIGIAAAPLEGCFYLFLALKMVVAAAPLVTMAFFFFPAVVRP